MCHRFEMALHVIELVVQSIFQRDQFLVRAHLTDTVVFQYHDLVRFADSGQTMGDDERSAALHQTLEGLLDQ